MAEYKLELTTGDMQYAGTWDHIFITLFGNEGQSERIELDNLGTDFTRGATGTYTIKTSSSLGKLLLVKVEKDPYLVLSEDECFVKATVGYYYPSDKEVRKDTELQEWINEIFIHGFVGNKASGFPACFHTVEEVIKFITMVIFTVTAQHAAVNNGQFDYNSWVPNGSLLLHQPPPTTKGESSMETILETLPNVGETVSFAAMACLLSEKYTDVVPLGAYPEERFDSPAPKQMIKDFQEEFSYLSEEITTRNSELKVPYTYLNPTQIENSITI